VALLIAVVQGYRPGPVELLGLLITVAAIVTANAIARPRTTTPAGQSTAAPAGPARQATAVSAGNTGPDAGNSLSDEGDRGTTALRPATEPAEKRVFSAAGNWGQ